jgi:hypothetical protein
MTREGNAELNGCQNSTWWFFRGRSKSHINKTCSTQLMAKRVVKKEVLGDETMTDYQFIQFEILNEKKYAKWMDIMKIN